MAATPEPVNGSDGRIRAALWFAEHGFGVFSCWSAREDGTCRCPAGPSCGSPGKHPITPNGFQDATRDEARIRTMLSAASHPNYGLVCPEGVFAWDVDGDGWRGKLATLEQRHGPLPPTLRTETRNGQHVFLRWPEGHPRPLRQMFGWVTRWGSGSHAGYVIGPRSIHPSGFEYAPAGEAFEVATLPDAWARAVLAAEHSTDTIRVGGRPDPATVAVGGRHEALRDTARFYAGTVRDPDALFAAVWAYNEKLPQPKTREEVQRAIGDALVKYPADPVEEDPETGEVRRVAPDREARGMLGAVDAEQFPGPPDPAAFAGLLGDVVRDLAAGTDASEVALLGSLLVFCGALIPARGHFGRAQTTSLFVGLVGVSSDGRKGTAMTRAQTAIGDVFGFHAPAQTLLDGVNSGEGLVTALETKQLRNRAEPTAGIMFEEEFATLLAAQNRDGSSLDSRMRAAWDGGPLSNRKQSGSQVVNPPYWLSALAAITPNELRDKAPKDATTTGSFNRWLWLPVVRRDIDVVDTRPDLASGLREQLYRARQWAEADPPFLELTMDAQRRLSAYSRHLAAHTMGLEEDLSRRLVPIAFRVALTHAAVEMSAQVTAEHVDRGIALSEYARSGVHWVFGFTVGDPIATLLLRSLREEGPLTKHQITQDFTRDPVKRQRAIDELTRLGFAEVVRVETGGRPKQELRLVGSRPLFTPFVQSVRSQPYQQEPSK